MQLDYPYPPTTWANQKLVLYHGTLDLYVSSVLRGIQVNRGRVNRDFGRGFYTTTLEYQARSWAFQQLQKIPNARPVVIRFEIDRENLANLDCLSFVRGHFDADDYWSFVFHCRKGIDNHGRPAPKLWYDMVIGPITASWQQRMAYYDSDQISFHTNRAASILNQGNPRVI